MEEKEKAYVALEQEAVDEDEVTEEELVEIDKNDEFKHTDSILYKAGKYAWVTEMPMTKSFFILFEVWRVILISCGIIGLISFIIGLFSGNFLESFLFALETIVIVLGIIFVLSIPAYYIVTKANNNKYTVLFEMDDKGIDHTQIKNEKSEALKTITMLLGLASKSFSLLGAGMLNASGSSLYSDFSKVRKIKAYREKGVIKLYGLFIRNQVYVDDENFPFVYSYIKRHAINAKEI